MNQVRERIHYIDVAKSIAIFLVIIGHINITDQTIKTEIYSFHIPLFFFLSGFVISLKKYDSFKDICIDKFKKIIIPYFWLSLITLIVKTFQSNYEIKDIIVKFCAIFLAIRDTEYYLSLWFLLSLFFSQLLLFVLYKILKKNLYLLCALFICFIIGYYISLNYYVSKNYILFSLDTVPLACFYLGLGYLFKKNYSCLKKRIQLKYILISLFFNILFCFLNYNLFDRRTDLYYQQLNNPFLYLISSLFGIWSILIISKRLENISLLRFIGKNSIFFYAFHKLIFPYADFCILWLSQFSNIFLESYIQISIYLIIIIIILSTVSIFINKYLPFIICKKTK